MLALYWSPVVPILFKNRFPKNCKNRRFWSKKWPLRAHFVACWSHVWSSGPHLGTCLMNVGAIGPHGGSWPPGGPMLGPYWSPVGPRRKVSFQKPSRTRDSRATKRSPQLKLYKDYLQVIYLRQVTELQTRAVPTCPVTSTKRAPMLSCLPPSSIGWKVRRPRCRGQWWKGGWLGATLEPGLSAVFLKIGNAS